jgi:LuxR family maltose regulon positive regulatory protein
MCVASCSIPPCWTACPPTAQAQVELGALLCEQNDLDSALRQVAEGIELGRRVGNLRAVVAGLLTLSRLERAQGDVQGAFDAVRRAEQLVQENNLVSFIAPTMAQEARLWVTSGDLAAAERCDAAARGLLSDFGLAILDFGQEATKSEIQNLKSRMIEPLTGRQLEVLRLVAGGASNQEIADALVITVSTVKVHVNRILGKLGVRSRTEAAARALGLL